MTYVNLVLFLIVMSAVTFVTDWITGVKTDHAMFFLWLAVGFGMFDVIRLARMWFYGVRIRSITIKSFGKDDPEFDARWDEAMRVLHIDDHKDDPNVNVTKVDIIRRTS